MVGVQRFLMVTAWCCVLTGVPVGAVAAEGTRLTRDGGILFSSKADVSFAVSYGARAIKAVVTSPEGTEIRIHVPSEPRNVFAGETRLAADNWHFDVSAGCVVLPVAAGESRLQIRFDDVESVAPFNVDVPIVLCGNDWAAKKELGVLHAVCADDRVHGGTVWRGAPGVYEIRLRAGKEGTPCSLAVASSRADWEHRTTVTSASAGEIMLGAQGVLELQGEAAGRTLGVEAIESRLIKRVAPMCKVGKGLVERADSIVVEAEAFCADGGGTTKVSSEHGNTHGGKCVWSWADPGHWLAWTVMIPKAGDYHLTFVGATDEDEAVRDLSIDGNAVAGAELVAFSSTGGWGRKDADEWQAFQPLAEDGSPIAVALSAGEHRIRLGNVLGQHLNMDCIVLTLAR